jgi:hypothetical protein
MSYSEIVGDEAEGACLLTVVPLPTPEEVAVDGAPYEAVPPEGGKPVAIDIAAGKRLWGQGAIKALLTGPRPETSASTSRGR